MSHPDDDLAYGRYHSNPDGGAPRGLVGDTFNKLRESYKYGQPPRPSQAYPEQGPPHHGPSYHGQPAKPDKLSGFLGKFQDAAVDIGSEFAGRMGTALDPQAYAEYGQQKPGTARRFGSFAAPRPDCDVKWHVDGCSYFYAVSRALEGARESIWILDWWLSPELYLRRPPAKNEQYRLDRMLQNAAQRGVRVNIVIYKEVPQALPLSSDHTKHHLEDLHPNIAVFCHPDHVADRQELASSVTESFQNLSLNENTLAQLPADAAKALYGTCDGSILYWSHQEKLCLIDGRIAFMGGLDLCFGRWDTHQHAIADAPADLSEIVFPGQDYHNPRVLGFRDIAHWEKNQLNRGVTSRMGWSDVSVSLHGPAVEDLRRHFAERWNFIYDSKYEGRKNPRYGRLALYGRPSSSHSGPHPATTSQPQYPSGTPSQSNNPAMASPFAGEQGASAHELPASGPPSQSQAPAMHGYTYTGDSFPPPPPGPPPGQYTTPSQSHGPSQSSTPYFPPPPGQSPAPSHNLGQTSSQAPYFSPPPTQEIQHQQARGMGDYREDETREEGDVERGLKLDPRRFREDFTAYGNIVRGQLAGQIHQYQDRLTSFGGAALPRGNMTCQILRSCSKWSHGVPTEHSVADAYAAVIRNSEHFVYIENEFFITATGDAQHPVKNKVGAAIVERILRAARAGKKYKIVVVIPSVPYFAGDLGDESAVSTRAIMEFQYRSINRGGNSIMELVAKEGYNPMEYIRFYNLRNYDRINVAGPAVHAEQASGASREDAGKPHGLATAGSGGYGQGSSQSAFDTNAPFQQHQQASHQVSGSKPSTSGRWDSVSQCYMLNGQDIRYVPWEGPSETEIDAFVSEEIYVHSKVMIADDRVAVCGSANLNDGSQLGDRNSEIAIIIEDYTPIQSSMNGKPWTASRFGASLRRELFRKHLGLLPPQDCQRPGADFEPVGSPSRCDFDSPESQVVADPLSATLDSLWNTRARTNTEVFRKVFHAVPDDTVRNWATYKEFYGYYFHAGNGLQGQPTQYDSGHVVRDDFPPGPEGARQVKELLSQVKGTLVEMPLMFLIEEDMAKGGLRLNDWAEPLYT